jgi:hypothetical protein
MHGRQRGRCKGSASGRWVLHARMVEMLGDDSMTPVGCMLQTS